MAYCTNQNVIDEFKSINTTDGKITTTKIDEWITQADAYIDGRLATIYTVPITGTNSLSIVKQISIGLVAQRVANILEMKATTPKGDQAVPKDLIEMAEKRLDMIVEKKLFLSDATKATTHEGVQSYTSENTVTRCFKQGTDQW